MKGQFFSYCFEKKKKNVQRNTERRKDKIILQESKSTEEQSHKFSGYSIPQLNTLIACLPNQPWFVHNEKQRTINKIPGLVPGHIKSQPSRNGNKGFPGGVKEPSRQCRRHKRRGFNPWIRKIPWRREWQPTLVFLSGESMGW